MTNPPELVCSWVVDVSDDPMVKSMDRPGLVRFRDAVYLFYRQAGSDELCYCTSAGGMLWSAPQSLTAKTGLTGIDAPVPVVVGKRLAVIVRGTAKEEPQSMWLCSTLDGDTWTERSRVPALTSHQPAPVVFLEELYLFFRGASAAGTVYVLVGDGERWLRPEENITAIDDRCRTKTTPFPVVFEYRLHVLAHRPSDDRPWYLSTGDGWDWSGFGLLGEGPSLMPPTAAMHGSSLYAFVTDGREAGRERLAVAVRKRPDGPWSAPVTLPQPLSGPAVPMVLPDRLAVVARSLSHPPTYMIAGTTDGTTWRYETGQSVISAAASPPAVLPRGYRATLAHQDPDQAIHTRDVLAPDPWGFPVRGVPDALARIRETGEYRVTLFDNFTSSVPNHLQSMARYRDRYVLPRSAPAGRPGWVHLTPLDLEGPLPYSFPMPENDLDHPGGCQVLGDYLVLAAENADRGVVLCYDLRPTASGALPIQVGAPIKAPKRAGAAGLTTIGTGADRRYLLGIYDDGEVTFLESTRAPLWSPDCRFTERFRAGTGSPGPDSMALLTDTSGAVHLLSLTSTGNVGSYADVLYRYDVDLTARTLTKKQEYPKTTVSGGTTAWLHFRFGAGVYLSAPDRIELLCSQRNPSHFYRHDQLSFNVFLPK
ncbi:sialidase family protein [Actinomadura kijaniata]|uniref:sialidase family protein n=1 Tax=Actinomadura kijaniata TaxID=46161 RepID=UPI003F1BB7FD